MDSIVKAGYIITNLPAKKSKPFRDSEFIKQCMVSMTYNVSWLKKKKRFL